MKIDKPANENYAATIVTIRHLKELDGCDNLLGAPLLGYQAIVDKTHTVGDMGVLFTAETQLSSEFAKQNNLHRHAELNKDPETKGYIEDSRRVKALKLRGHRSDALFMPLSSLTWTGVDISQLREGDTFDTLGGYEICRKYQIARKASQDNKMAKATKKFKRVDAKYLPTHYGTANYWRNSQTIPQDANVVVTQKLHGTSTRIGHTICKVKPRLRDRIAAKFGVTAADHTYDYVYGSRKVIKDANSPNQNHYYSSDIWTEHGKKLDGLVPKGFVVYGELIGWTPDGKPIQKNYTYRIPEGEAQLYVYRVAHVNPDGLVTDLSWGQVKEFCVNNGLNYVPELWRGPHSEFNPDEWIDKRYFESGYRNAVQLDNGKKIVDEGVCVRMDGLMPTILKAKSPIFLNHESKMLDEEALDLEAEGSEVAV